ncbi:Uncharacterised protein [Mycobacteroides abscessus subsp. abscessus]|nr:Uncharacterised protein [Mycobacteroides abscessus subsp. abscessus]
MPAFHADQLDRHVVIDPARAVQIRRRQSRDHSPAPRGQPCRHGPVPQGRFGRFRKVHTTKDGPIKALKLMASELTCRDRLATDKNRCHARMLPDTTDIPRDRRFAAKVRVDACKRQVWASDGRGDYMLAMRRSTRSSTDRNGSLHSTVRCAWSLSLRCTQSTVKSRPAS